MTDFNNLIIGQIQNKVNPLKAILIGYLRAQLAEITRKPFCNFKKLIPIYKLFMDIDSEKYRLKEK